MRRGACPTLTEPMLTGDGWLARLTPAGGLTPAQLGGLARASARRGNGRIEVTSRGNLQFRGLTPESARALGEDVAELGIAPLTGVSVRTGPLAGLDAREVADPRPIAERIRAGAAGLAGRLGPKVSVVVDGGGALGLDDVGADIRLRAEGAEWLVAVADRVVGRHDDDGAVLATLDVLERLAGLGGTARAGDLGAGDLGGEGPAVTTGAPAVPIGGFALRDGSRARGFGLPFGQIDSEALSAFAAAAAGAREVRPAPGRALLVVGLASGAVEDLTRAGARLGFVVDPDDPRLSVIACSGAPACRSAHLATRALAEALVAERPDLVPGGVRLHLSGCAKRCAQPKGATITLVATAGGCEITAQNATVPEATRDFLARRVAEMGMAS